MNVFRCELNYQERLRLAWQLTWPAVTLDVAWSFLVRIMLETSSPGVDALYLVPYLFFIAPWLVRRMFRLKYPGFRLKTVTPAGEVQMGYTESFKVMWLISWRMLIVLLLFLFFISPLLSLIQVQLSTLVPTTQEAPFVNAVGLSVLENGVGLFLMPFVMPGMFHKRYQGFRVVAERLGARGNNRSAMPVR